MRIEAVHATQLTAKDIQLITKGCLAVKILELDPKHLVEMALNGKAMIYRIVGDKMLGIVVITVRGSEVWLEIIAGHGLVKHFDEIHEWLIRMAHSWGMKTLCGIVTRPGLKRLWERHEARSAASYMIKEIRDGRKSEPGEDRYDYDYSDQFKSVGGSSPIFSEPLQYRG